MGSTTTVFAIALPVAVYIWVTSGSYWFARLWCDFDTIIPSTVNPTSDAQNLRVLLVSDPHILGSKRSSMDQQWTNWHIGLAYDHSVQYSNPDIVFGLGDLLDEGRRSMLSKPGWEKYSEEGLKAFHLRSDKGRTSSEAPPFLGIVGNHDVGWRYALSPDAVRLFETKFFQEDASLFAGSGSTQHVAPANFWWKHPLVDIVRLNSMALDPHVRPQQLLEDTWKFMRETAASRADSDGKPLILLTHMPLYRPNDEQCGSKRTSEGGGVTFKAPHEAYIVDDEVLSSETSTKLLNTLQPDIVFSGHVHARCLIEHSTSELDHTIPEATISAFGWRMRPDPSFAVATFQVSSGTIVGLTLETCPLPHEHILYAIIGATVLLEVVLLVRLVCKLLGRRGGTKMKK